MHRDALTREVAVPRGFSLVELLVAMVVSSVIMAGVLSLLINENRRISQQRELSDTWLTLRSAAEVIAFDLRNASASGGDLSALTDTSFTVRSRRGSAVICATGVTGYALTNVTGEFNLQPGDSIQVMTVETSPVWKNVVVSGVGTSGVVGPQNCVWTGSGQASMGLLAVGPVGELANVTVGSAVHAFRSTQYGIMTSADGRRWLGRKVSGAATWEVVTGPLRTNGLRLTYYTSAGATTTTADQVASVRITLRGESFGRADQRKVMQDTLSVRVVLRN